MVVYLPPQAINWVGVQDCSMMEYVAEKGCPHKTAPTQSWVDRLRPGV